MNRFRSGGRSRGRNSKGSELHNAVCSECGEDCKVPFRPTSDKPIYCSDCFEKKGGGDRRSGGRDSRRRGSGDRRSGRSPRSNSDKSIVALTKSIENLSSKLDAIIDVLPSGQGVVEVKNTSTESDTPQDESPKEVLEVLSSIGDTKNKKEKKASKKQADSEEAVKKSDKKKTKKKKSKTTKKDKEKNVGKPEKDLQILIEPST